ncbi:MAG TPA: hypothetical protein VFE16_14030 [Candidatus Cybelea sp.]|jgi:hypothetical protein|nr:hypothetical protein [Candidatus Cybelea sp.]
MLRALVIAIGVACIVGAVFLAQQIWFLALELGVFGALVLIGTFFEGRYRGRRATGSGWQSTSERFVDPTSGKLVEVRYNPRTGERAYVDGGKES